MSFRVPKVFSDPLLYINLTITMWHRCDYDIPSTQEVNVESQKSDFSILVKHANCKTCSLLPQKWLCSLFTKGFGNVLERQIYVLQIFLKYQDVLNGFRIRADLPLLLRTETSTVKKKIVLPLEGPQIPRKKYCSLLFDFYQLKYEIIESDMFWKSLIFSKLYQ